jgi:hypothetical protein
VPRSCRAPLSVAVLAASVALLPAHGVAQSASDIVERMLSEYARRVAEVDNYTLVQQTMGFETVSYFEKEIVDGRPVFRSRSSVTALGVTAEVSEDNGVDDVYAIGEELGRRGRYAGVRSVDDYDLHVIEVSDLTGLDFGADLAPDSDFRPKSGTFFLDVDTYVPRRLEFVGSLTNEEGVHDITSIIEMGDYREVQGMLVPHRTVVTIEGLGEAIDAETRAQFEEMQRELENLPPQQRAMVEQMMAGQLEQFRSMMAGEDAPMTFQALVTAVRVNQGPPAR